MVLTDLPERLTRFPAGQGSTVAGVAEAVCAECKGEVPQDARRCVHCGHQITGAPWAWIIAGAILLIVGAIVYEGFQQSTRDGEPKAECFVLTVDESKCD
jgi:hypothetical protein